MPKRYREAIYREAQEGIFRGRSDEQLHADLKVPIRTITNWRTNLKRYGSVFEPSKGPMGTPPKLNDEHMEALIEYLCDRPTACLEEMCWFLFDCFSVIVTISCVSKRLKALKYALHAAQKEAAQRTAEARDAWNIKRAEYHAQQLVIVDESAACERNLDRKYGWSRVGVPARIDQDITRSKRYSLLPAYTVDGFISTKIHQGLITKELFNEWIYNEVLPCCRPFPRPRSVLVMEYCEMHISEELEQMCAAANVRLEYLPPYSPDFNPIEGSFHDLKAWLKKNNTLVNEEDFPGLLQAAVDSHPGKSAKQHFRRFGYRMK